MMPTSVPGRTDAHRHQGFTLLELLVVLVIVSILLGAVALNAIPGNGQLLQDDAQRIALLLQAARDEAQRILDDARVLAADERAEVESYIDGRLATLEVILNKTIDAVARGRERLDGANDKDVLSQLADDK